MEVTCPGCGKAVRLAGGSSPDGAGTIPVKKVACSHCGTLLTVGGATGAEPASHKQLGGAIIPPRNEGDAPGIIPFPTARAHTGAITSLSFSAGGTLAISSSSDGTIRFWDVDTGRETGAIPGGIIPGGTIPGAVSAAAINVDGTFLLFGGADGNVYLWHVTKGACVRTFEGHKGEGIIPAVTGVAFYPGGGYAYSAGADGTVRAWEMSSGKCKGIGKKHKGAVTSLAADPEGHYVLSGGLDGTLRLWRPDKCKELGRLTGHGGPVRSVRLNSDGGLAISGSDDLNAAVWSVSRQKVLKVLKGHTARVLSADINKDNTLAATGSADWSLRIWNVDTGEAVHVIEAEERAVTAVTFSPRGKRVLAGYEGGAIRLWDARTSKLVKAFGGTRDSLATRCPACGKVIAIEERFEGHRGACPSCGAAFTATAYDPRRSREAAARGFEAIGEGHFETAARDFDEAIKWQGDNYEATLNGIICRNCIATNLAEEGKSGEAVEVFDEALRLYGSVAAWPVELVVTARNEAYAAAFESGKLWRYRLNDMPRAISYLKRAQQINGTVDVADMLAHIDRPGETGGEGA